MRIGLSIVGPLGRVMREAEAIIDNVHSIWELNKKTYPAGYAVFYSVPRSTPDLMLVGLNPGGGPECFHGEKEWLMPPEQPMEYVECQHDRSYPLAGKTVALFRSIGMLPALTTSLKTNLNFFRSRNWGSLPQQHAETCLTLVLRMIEVFGPKVVLCESILVFDRLYGRMKEKYPLPVHKLGKRGRRIYTSVWGESSRRPVLLAAITHLTGSRPTSNDLDRIKQSLRDDLVRAFTPGSCH